MTDEQIQGGKVLATLRQKANLTQAELAQKASISRSMVAQLEIGERRPSQKIIHALCRAMNVTEGEINQLLVGYGFLPVASDTAAQVTALLRADKNLPPEQVEKLTALIHEAYRNAQPQ